MTGREWTPGEVAMLTVLDPAQDGRARHSVHHLAIRDNVGSWVSGTAYGRVLQDRYVTDARPLVVIDPDDREQVKRLADALGSLPYQSFADRVQDALRSLVAPPKPDEPTGLGAVVEDESSRRWVRVARERNRTWTCDELGAWKGYAEIAAVRVLSEGVPNA